MKSILMAILLCLTINHGYGQLQRTPKYTVEGTLFDTLRAKINHGKPIFMNGNMPDNDTGKSVLFSCVITPYNPKIVSSYHFQLGAERTNTLEIGHYEGRSFAWLGSKSVKEMLRHLYGKPWRLDTFTGLRYMPIVVPNSRVTFAHGMDTTKLVSYLNYVVQQKNWYTIQLTSSTSSSHEEMAKNMIGAIELQFGLKTKFEKQRKKCIVASRSNIPIPEYKDGDIMMKFGMVNGRFNLQFNKVTIEALFERIERYFSWTGYPIVDETGFTKHLGMFEFNLPTDLTYDSMKENFAKLGIKLNIEEREVDVLVISKKQ